MIPKAIALSVLVFSTVMGPYIIYHLLFAIWMTAHPLYDSQAWRIRVYERFGFTLLDGLICVGSIFWLWRTAKSRQSSEQATNRSRL